MTPDPHDSKLARLEEVTKQLVKVTDSLVATMKESDNKCDKRYNEVTNDITELKTKVFMWGSFVALIIVIISLVINLV